MPKDTIENMRHLAQMRGGQCLSAQYINTDTKLCWQCQAGHQWEAIPKSIKQGTWCPVCSHCRKLTMEQIQQQRASKWQIEDMCSIAEERGGRCLSKKYRNVRSKLLWQCANGHQWSAMPASILSGSWCAACLGRGKTIDDMQAVAKTRGGQCLSDAYVTEQTKLLWECSEGHQWRGTAVSKIC
ncbi:MAG: hypothetical protein GY862_32980 [Gammaproteobacteria bacterium]|nr:hypothetical protein [Gammaproteobacteria bacterium]